MTLATGTLLVAAPAALGVTAENECINNNGQRCYAEAAYRNWEFTRGHMWWNRPSDYRDHCAGGENPNGTIRGNNACTPVFGTYVFKYFDRPVNVRAFSIWHGGGAPNPISVFART